ncbi:MAG: ASKHA domain-containing protein [Coriobacteriales bacterium]|jgi:uncharacterized 2Fe-2S/4Fe-4S cluster protein (DUF4445 family)|nr:ASKHA domain-containing protein [Coriobacteriales bacterium]
MSESKKNVSFLGLGTSVTVNVGDNLLDIIRTENIPINADCGGIGRCGKCRVLVNGKKRLACRTHVVEDIEVQLVADKEGDKDYAILLDYDGPAGVPGGALASAAEGAASPTKLAIAVDIGTTTVVGKLLDLSTGSELGSFALLNSQLPFGADVISRINASLDDSSELCGLITTQIDAAVAGLLKDTGLDAAKVEHVVIAGNTTMSYILLGLPCRSLGFVPFEPAHYYPLITPYPELFKTNTLSCDCVVLPFISAYVGGDLTSGLCTLSDEDDFILMDMGTNGELIFKRGERLICTATAAGPAFEGGNIECGSGSTRGAISWVAYDNGAYQIKTIGAGAATGICGSGILDLMAILVREGLIDETGYMSDAIENSRIVLARNPELDGDGEVFFTQKDVRQFQLAKSAVRTGLEIIMEEMGGDPPSKVFLAGGFGQNLDPNSALMTGLLPAEFAGRVRSIGNSSLSGAVKVCLSSEARASVEKLAEDGQEINLAAHRLFNDLFMNHMSFEIP